MTVSTVGKRALNFNAGPAGLPLPVLERIREELLDYRGTGMSVMEMSHRSSEFEDINARAEKGVRKHLGVPDDYTVLFLQGGASLQFAMVPMNIFQPGKPVDVLHTGAWTAKAISELKKIADHRIAASTEASKFTRVPRPDEISLDPNASYVHLAMNNTIEGTEYASLPDTGAVPIVADMSSDILSAPVDVKRCGLIFAGAQKNLGPSGVTLVVLRNDLMERASKNLPAILQYRTHAKEHSLYNTPPAFAVYVLGLVMDWMEAEGGLPAIAKRNAAKAKLLYDALDATDFYSCPVEKDSRSKMNIVFRVAGGDEGVEKLFLKESEASGMVGLGGHRSVGGMRASLYNAVTLEATEALVRFMRDFERSRG